jgi:hypothetical protein
MRKRNPLLVIELAVTNLHHHHLLLLLRCLI